METRIYVVSYDRLCQEFGDEIDVNGIKNVDDETFMALAEEEGTVYSIQGFKNQWNENSDMMVNPDFSFMRFIEI